MRKKDLRLHRKFLCDVISKKGQIIQRMESCIGGKLSNWNR
jgi:hypothetical protein